MHIIKSVRIARTSWKVSNYCNQTVNEILVLSDSDIVALVWK